MKIKHKKYIIWHGMWAHKEEKEGDKDGVPAACGDFIQSDRRRNIDKSHVTTANRKKAAIVAGIIFQTVTTYNLPLSWVGEDRASVYFFFN